MPQKKTQEWFVACGIGNRIKELRDELGWKINFLSDRTGIRASYISDVENYRKGPSAQFLFDLKSGVPEASLDWLLTGQGSKFVSKTQRETHVVRDLPSPEYRQGKDLVPVLEGIGEHMAKQLAGMLENLPDSEAAKLKNRIKNELLAKLL